MEEPKSGMTWLGVLFFVVILLVLLGGGLGNGFGNGWGNRNGCAPEGGCGRVSNCEVEKNEIVDSARTQFLIEQNGAATRTAIRDSRDEVMGQASRIYEQRLQETIFDLKMGGQAKDAKIAQLEAQIHNDAKFGAIEKQFSDCCCAFNRRLDGIECNMLTKPNLYGVAATCSGQTIPSGFNLLSGCNTCGGNRNI